MKEIHFYTNLTNEEQTSEKDLDEMCVDYMTTKEAIQDTDTHLVRTTQLSFLRNAWDYIAAGHTVYIHNGNEVYQVKEHMGGTDKDIKVGQDLSRLLIGGTFGKIC